VIAINDIVLFMGNGTQLAANGFTISAEKKGDFV